VFRQKFQRVAHLDRLGKVDAEVSVTTTTLEHYIPLPQAAKRLGISPASLQGLIEGGIIAAVELGGTIAVAENDLDQIITREQFEHFRGQAITIASAVKKYNLGQMTIRGWIERGYIRVLKTGYGMTIDEADVAYCTAVYKAKGGVPGKRIFDDKGHPYQPKHTEWAEYQRERRKKKKTH
jgi:hypothetical protein